MVNRRTGELFALNARLIASMLLLTGAEFATAAEPVPQAEPTDEELGEVLIEDLKPERDPQKVINWLANLVGEFTYEGYVDVHAQANPEDIHAVRGSGSCVGYGPAPAVQCDIHVRWSQAQGRNGEAVLGGVSTLDPAIMLFGFASDRVGIRYMLVDSEGTADAALGYVVGNTLISRSPCASVPGNCDRVVHITISEDAKQIDMRIDLEVDYRRAVRFEFRMVRMASSKALVVPSGSQ
jgi:hypothetical protein